METPSDDRIPVAGPVADGVALHVRRWGATATGRPFVLVHGLSSNARLWDGVAAVLAAAGHPVTAIDLRSHGESDAPATGYDTATAASDVAAVIHELNRSGADPADVARSGVVLAGQSWGGDVVVQVAARHPAVVAALALVDGGWSDLAASFPSWEACEKSLRPPDIDGRTADELRGWFRSGHPDWHDAAIEATLANMRVASDGTVSRRLSIPHHMQIVRSMWDDPPARYYPDIHVPVLLMPALPGPDSGTSPDHAGERERSADRRRRIAEAARSLGGAEVHEYVDGDHDLHAQQPDLVAADLLALAGRAA